MSSSYSTGYKCPDCGIVYPAPVGTWKSTSIPPMTLHQYYAGQALQGFFSGIPFDVETPMTEVDDKYLQEVAKVCFKMAKAMIQESER